MLLLQLPGTTRAADKTARVGGDREVAELFKAVEGAFRQKNVNHIVAHLHRKFFYLMTFCTDGRFSAVEHDRENYRSRLGGFFMSDPEIRDYSIYVEHIEKAGEEVRVLARITSSVVMNGIVSTCEAFSNYTLLREQNLLLIRWVRGDATCTHRDAGEENRQ